MRRVVIYPGEEAIEKLFRVIELLFKKIICRFLKNSSI